MGKELPTRWMTNDSPRIVIRYWRYVSLEGVHNSVPAHSPWIPMRYLHWWVWILILPLLRPIKRSEMLWRGEGGRHTVIQRDLNGYLCSIRPFRTMEEDQIHFVLYERNIQTQEDLDHNQWDHAVHKHLKRTWLTSTREGDTVRLSIWTPMRPCYPVKWGDSRSNIYILRLRFALILLPRNCVFGTVTISCRGSYRG